MDACPGGWVGIALVSGTFSAAHFGATLASLLDEVAGTPAAVGVDIPLGLLDAGWRPADDAAKAFIGPRRASIFRVPPRAAWLESDFATANRRCRELTGGGLTQQAWGLRVKLLEANALAEASQVRDSPLYEVHPEVSFRAIAGRDLSHAKTSWAGHADRQSLLARAGIILPDRFGGSADRVPPIDVVDAAAVAWSAYRIALGRAVPLPSHDDRDPLGRRIAIWY
ncbi:MAG: DUF429 domain-containing protein [Frankia sp.]